MAKRRLKTVARTFIQRGRNVSAEKKALVHQVLGAGRAGTLRSFVGLTAPEEAEIEKRLQALIDSELSKRS